MDLSKEKQREYANRIRQARVKVLTQNGFFGILLMHLKPRLDLNLKTAATDGEYIYFSPAFLDIISDQELVFVMTHEIMHVVLRHLSREGNRDHETFNDACDIVVNSNILQAAGMDLQSITIDHWGEPAMHVTPKGDEGYNYTAEQVYDMFPGAQGKRNTGTGQGAGGDAGNGSAGGFRDDHSKWGANPNSLQDTIWENRIKDAAKVCVNGIKGSGNLPAGIERELKELLEPKTNWRVLLNDFVQEEITDYSFAPPDRRFDDSPFMLPDFNDTEYMVKDILFMIDTSGSMSEEAITQAYSEVKGAIDQFGGKLEGWLGFFDAEVVEPKKFTDINEFKIIRPKGGGGTSFHAIFEYVEKEMADLDIAGIIILTDGYAPFPDESAARGIPVLWMINNDRVKPPWGKVAVFE